MNISTELIIVNKMFTLEKKMQTSLSPNLSVFTTILSSSGPLLPRKTFPFADLEDVSSEDEFTSTAVAFKADLDLNFELHSRPSSSLATDYVSSFMAI